MEVIYILIAFSVSIALFFLGAFIWAVKNGQYDDNFTPALRILNEEKQQEYSSSNQLQENQQ